MCAKFQQDSSVKVAELGMGLKSKVYITLASTVRWWPKPGTIMIIVNLIRLNAMNQFREILF